MPLPFFSSTPPFHHMTSLNQKNISGDKLAERTGLMNEENLTSFVISLSFSQPRETGLTRDRDGLIINDVSSPWLNPGHVTMFNTTLNQCMMFLKFSGFSWVALIRCATYTSGIFAPIPRAERINNIILALFFLDHPRFTHARVVRVFLALHPGAPAVTVS